MPMTKQTGNVSAFAEVQNGIDELRAKMKVLIGTTTCSSVETADHYLAKAMSSLEDYFEWAGCYDDERKAESDAMSWVEDHERESRES